MTISVIFSLLFTNFYLKLLNQFFFISLYLVRRRGVEREQEREEGEGGYCHFILEIL